MPLLSLATVLPALNRVGFISGLSNGIDRIVAVLLPMLMTVLVLDVAAQLVCRYVLELPFAESEEIATGLFIWITFLGASTGLRQRSHPALAFLTDRLPKRTRRVVELFGQSCSAYFLGFLAIQGTQAVIATSAQTTAILEMPIGFINASLPVVGAMMLLHQLANTLEDMRPRWPDALVIVASLGGLALLQNQLRLESGIYDYIALVVIVLLFVRVPISIALGLTTLLAISAAGLRPIQEVYRMIGGLNNFTLLAIPFFMLTGAIMAAGSMATRLTEFANQLVGWMRGGLGMADILVSIIFADISGSAVADTAAIGSVMLPNMIKRGYDRNFATALQASAGSLGMQFPPSITMILYAWVASVSVTALFMASFLPGLLVAGSFALVTYVVARRRGYPREKGFRLKLLWQAFRGCFFALIAPVIILGGIISGIMTPTESGVVAVLYSLLVCFVIYRDLSPRAVGHLMVEATVGVSRVTFLVSCALALSWILIVKQGPQALAAELFAFSDNPLVILLLINLLIVVVHTVLEPAATMLVLVPVLIPMIRQIGIDPIYFGIIFVVNSAMGMLLPPVGFCLYIACGVSGAPLEGVTKAILPFVGAIVLDLVLLVLFPDIVLVLPRFFGML